MDAVKCLLEINEIDTERGVTKCDVKNRPHVLRLILVLCEIDAQVSEH